MKAFGTVSTKRLFCLFHSLLAGERQTSPNWGVSLLTQARKNVWSVFLYNCDWIHFCGLGCVFGRGSRSLHLLCVVGRLRQALCLRSVLWVGNHWAEHVLLLCISYRSIVWANVDTQQLFLLFFFFSGVWINYHFARPLLQEEVVY